MSIYISQYLTKAFKYHYISHVTLIICSSFKLFHYSFQFLLILHLTLYLFLFPSFLLFSISSATFIFSSMDSPRLSSVVAFHGSIHGADCEKSAAGKGLKCNDSPTLFFNINDEETPSGVFSVRGLAEEYAALWSITRTVMSSAKLWPLPTRYPDIRYARLNDAPSVSLHQPHHWSAVSISYKSSYSCCVGMGREAMMRARIKWSL